MEVQVTDEVRRFLAVNTGSGSGSGSGYGSGYGSGSGYGYGYGYGSGNGYGNGDGDGSGDGYGSGYGYGDGDGDGSGDGYGSGDGLQALDGQHVHLIDGVQTVIASVTGNYARGFLVQKDLTLKPCYIAKHGNFFAHGETLKEAVRDAVAKWTKNRPLEERIADFCRLFPTSETTAKCSVFYDWHNILTGSCRMGRDQFVKEHGLDMEADYTVEYFLKITRSAYGGDVIRELEKRYLGGDK